MKKHKKYLIFIFFTFGIYFIRLFKGIVSTRPDGFYAGHQNVWSDWALHVTLTNIFANKPINEWFLYHPFFSGGKLTYPFLTNLISGLLMKLGLTINLAMILPSILLILLFIFGIYFLNYQIFNSRKKSLLAMFIFMTSAGPGFINFIKTFIKNPNLDLALFPPLDYTRIVEYQWLAGNIPTAMLIPQRAFLIGVAIGVWSLLTFVLALKTNGKKNQKKQIKLFIISGLLAGILPIAHMHSFIAIVVILGTISVVEIFKNSKINGKAKKSAMSQNYNLAFFILPATILSSILFLKFVHGGIERDNFMKIDFGWTSKNNIFSWIEMWWQLWGIMIPISIYSYYKLIKSKIQFSYFLGFFGLFIISNIIIFQPTPWDNSKLFAWVYLGLSLLAANLIIDIWKKHKLITILFMIMLSTTGILELIRLQRFDKNTYMMSSNEEINFAREVMSKTATDSIFLTTSDHNNPIQMWGSRSIVLGYKGWVANFGFDFEERSKDVSDIYQYPEYSQKLINKYKIDYVVIGTREIREFKVNKQYFEEHYAVAFKNIDTTIFDIKYKIR